MKFGRNHLILYAVTDRTWLHGKTLVQQVEASLKGGVSLVQLREKGMNHADFLAEAREIKALCDRYGVPLIINDNVEIALAVDAAGVHVGQEDMEAGVIRERLGNGKIIGVSAHNVEEARRAETAGADYLGAGAVFGTNSKQNVTPMPKETLKAICEAVSIPVVAIGGIGRDNLPLLQGTGIAGAAVISGIYAAPDIEAAARELKTMAQAYFGGDGE